MKFLNGGHAMCTYLLPAIKHAAWFWSCTCILVIDLWLRKHRESEIQQETGLQLIGSW